MRMCIEYAANGLNNGVDEASNNSQAGHETITFILTLCR